ncbi:PRD domain-containing protein [Lactiplantibacillus plantarum]|uniref:PRD domain-containing protein n=1 Tax=Lactiplantibacillus plantarum TaxID=1590 RepID=UPI0021CD12C8|nr:PRD domain-containing protein [Lactiplantibacillus plantarum]
MNDYHIDNSNEVDYLVKLINSSQFAHVNWNDDLIQKLKPFSVRMISSFNHLSGAHVSIKSISDSLTVHLLSTYYRAQYNMPFEYPDLKSIQQHYHHTFEITRKVVVPFEQYIHHTLSDDEIALIAMVLFVSKKQAPQHKMKYLSFVLVASVPVVYYFNN